MLKPRAVPFPLASTETGTDGRLNIVEPLPLPPLQALKIRLAINTATTVRNVRICTCTCSLLLSIKLMDNQNKCEMRAKSCQNTGKLTSADNSKSVISRIAQDSNALLTRYTYSLRK